MPTPRFRTYLATLAFTSLALFGGAELYARTLLIPHHNLAKQVQQMLFGVGDDLIIGDSHTGGAFRHPVEGFTNISLGGMNILMMEAITDSALTRHQPKRAMVVASPQLFAPYRLQQTAGDYVGLPMGPITPWQHIYLAHPLMRQALLDDLLSRTGLNSVAENDPSLDKEWAKTNEDTRRRMTAPRVTMQMPAEGFETQTHTLAYERMVQKLVATGAQVCLIRPPVTTYYEDLYRESPLANAVDTYFTTLAAKYNARYVTYHDLPHTFTAEEFQNQDHLNEQGSATYVPLILQACFN